MEYGKWKMKQDYAPEFLPQRSGYLRLVVEGEFDERVAAFEFELLADVGAVVLDRAVADEEFRRDLFAGLFLGDQFQDAPLCGGEIVEVGLGFGERVRTRGAIEQEGRDRRADVMIAGGHRADAVDDVGSCAVFEHVAFGAEVERLVEDVLVLVHRQEDHFDGDLAVAQGAQQIEAGQSRHLDVEHGDIGPLLFDLVERRLAVVRFGQNFESRIGFNDLAQSRAQERMIISDDETNLRSHNLSFALCPCTENYPTNDA